MIHLHEPRTVTPRPQLDTEPAQSWRDDALCAQIGPNDELWMPGKGGSTSRAVAVCRRCPVIDACADYALNHPQHLDGVFGGLTVNQRKAIRRPRRDGATAA
ncbi:MAG TPA: WhiB family transcriptional regulator [Phytomonospora sp.]